MRKGREQGGSARDSRRRGEGKLAGGHGRAWALDLRHVFGRAIRLHRERDQVAPATFARRRLLIENATDRLVFDRYVAPKIEAARLQRRYRTHRDSLYAFLHRADLEPTNNSTERDLRPSVIHRKVIGGFRSDWGAEASAIRTSIFATAHKQSRNLFRALLAIAGPSPLQAIPARARPSTRQASRRRRCSVTLQR